jgi:MbtH protein
MGRLMAGNPFEDETGTYLALVNDEGQYSLWPARITVPAGWTVVYRGGSRKECLDYIEESWVDMRPKSLIAAMDKERPSGEM